MDVIKYKRTVVGWYNFTVAGVMVYNVEPSVFRRITGVSDKASMGTAEVTTAQLIELKNASRFIRLAQGWEWLAS